MMDRVVYMLLNLVLIEGYESKSSELGRLHVD